jgi:hypothetical protein
VEGLQVDIDVLRNLALSLQTIADSMATAKDEFTAVSETLGSDEVAASLGKLCSGWRDGRTKIQNETQNLSLAISGVTDSYQDTERGIQDAFTMPPAEDGAR